MSGEFTVEYAGKSDLQGGGHGRISQCQIIFAGISKPLDHQEGELYVQLQDTPLAKYIPKFYGIKDGSIIIEDITAGFSSPCMADLKVGTRHYDLKATREKIEYLTTKQIGSTTDSHGVRVIDAKVRRNKEVVKQWDRKQGLKFSYDELRTVMEEFTPVELRRALKTKIQIILGKFAKTLEKNPGFRMYASSLLIAYDGDDYSKGIRVLLIDFAHTYINIAEHGGNIDDPTLEDGVLKGMGSTIRLLE